MWLSFSSRLELVLLLTIVVLLGVLVMVTLAAPGDPDPGFGTDGRVTTDFSGAEDSVLDIVVQPDGKIILAGYAHDGQGGGFGSGTDFALARYTVSGTLDSSFGTGGIVTTVIGVHPLGYGHDRIHGVARQSDGKIVVVGYADFSSITGDYDVRIAVARYKTDGTLDASFDGDGIVTSKIASSVNYGNAVALQSDGKIVAAGHVTSTGLLYDFVVVRYDEYGTKDSSFGSFGGAITRISDLDDSANAVAVQSDGKIVAAGSAGYPDTGSNFALVRYSGIDGGLDPGFGVNGVITTHVGGNDVINDIALQSDGKIVAVGSTQAASGDYDFAVARYTPSGSLDAGFGTGGIVTTTFGSNSRDEARGVVILQNGKIVVVGSGQPTPGVNSFALACYNTDGSLDTTFGTGGITTTVIENGTSSGRAIAVHPNGRLDVAGDHNQGEDAIDFALVQYYSPYISTVYLPMVLRMP